MMLNVNLYAQQKNPENLLKKVSDDTYMLKEMTINVGNGTIEIPCKINMNEGLIEVVLCRPEGKVHESLLVTDVSPLEFQTALMLLGLDPVNEVPDDLSEVAPTAQFSSVETAGDDVRLYLIPEDEEDGTRVPVENYIFDESTGRTLKPSKWLFRGAATTRNGHVLADSEVTMIATYHDPVAMMELDSESKFNDELFYVNKDAKLTIGKNYKLIIEKI